jgi:2-methylisocitrate lyase-like PEP mutase family enzyme
MKKTEQIRQLLQAGKTAIAPGVFDGLSARLVEQAKFSLVYASGGAIARSSGYPDLGLLGVDEVVERLAQIVEATTLPVIADADNGFGNALNVYRTVKTYEKLGVAALHLEDQVVPKRCGHLDDKKIIPVEEMVQKIKAACEARQDKNLLLIARTDAIAVEGFDQAIKRAQTYVNAGADMLFIEAPQSIEQIEKIAQVIKTPKLINMFYGGKTPLVPIDQLAKWGYQIVIIPSDLQRAAIHAMQKTLSVIHRNGDSKEIADELATFNEREKIIGTDWWLKLDKNVS